MVSIEFCRDIWIQRLKFFILLLLFEFHPFHTVHALKNTIFLRSWSFFFFFFLDLLGLFLSFQVVFWTVSTASMRAVLWISVSGFLSFMVVVLRYLNKSLHSTSLLLMSISCSVSVILIVVTLLFFVLISIPYIIAVLPSFVIVFAHPGPIPPIKSTSSSKDRLPILLPPTDSTPSKFSESFDIKCSRKQLKGCGNRRHHFLTLAAIWNYLLSVLPSSALLSTL